ncbi:hypothetical protein [Salinirussus salinus]|uniref:hypothetical protein n=1 Tax=Salinirussus salinus TaxID=1198300 RepID=UPI001359061D|nr:hypothetical protein [Salinirussus salinus]
MTQDITTEAEFAASLTELLRAADEGGVNPRGGWTCRTGDEHPDLEAVITELAPAPM